MTPDEVQQTIHLFAFGWFMVGVGVGGFVMYWVMEGLHANDRG